MKVEVNPIEINVVPNDSRYDVLDTYVTGRSSFLEVKGDKVINKKNGDVFDKEKYIDDIIGMDLAISYFQSHLIYIKSSILLREFFYSFGDFARWGSSSRYQNPERIVKSGECVKDIEDDKLYEEYIQAIEDYKSGKITRFDSVRERMPLSFQVNYSIKLPLKQFAKYICIFGLKYKSKYPNMWKDLYVACWNNKILRPFITNLEKYATTEEFKNFSDKFEGQVQVENSTNNEVRYKNNKLYTYIGKIGMVLFSQLIRHEGILTSGYCSFLDNEDAIRKGLTCKADFKVYIHCSEDRLLEVVRVRTNTFAVNTVIEDPNSWLRIIEQFLVYEEDGSVSLEKNKHLFPWFNKDGTLNWDKINTYNLDDGLKLFKGYSTYFPDFMAMEWPSIITCREHCIGKSFLTDLYRQHFKLGYMKDNPNNELRKKWLSLNPDVDFDKIVKEKYEK